MLIHLCANMVPEDLSSDTKSKSDVLIYSTTTPHISSKDTSYVPFSPVPFADLTSANVVQPDTTIKKSTPQDKCSETIVNHNILPFLISYMNI